MFGGRGKLEGGRSGRGVGRGWRPSGGQKTRQWHCC